MKQMIWMMTTVLSLAVGAAGLDDFLPGGSFDNLDWPTEEYEAGMSAWELANKPADASATAGLFFATCFSVRAICDQLFAMPSCWSCEGPATDVRTRFGMVIVFR